MTKYTMKDTTEWRAYCGPRILKYYRPTLAQATEHNRAALAGETDNPVITRLVGQGSYYWYWSVDQFVNGVM